MVDLNIVKISNLSYTHMNVLLVEPTYYTKYPPLGLLKLASYYRQNGHKVQLVRGIEENLKFIPRKIEITSLFTYAWQPVHDAIEFYHKKFPFAKITIGGIYASMMPERIQSYYPFINIHVGLHDDAELLRPAYDLLEKSEKWNHWKSSILFSSRGCVRSCPFCIVPKIEGKIRTNVSDISSHIYPGHTDVILWDNNFFASPNWREILRELNEIEKRVDFNQGLDIRLIDAEKASMLSDLNIPTIRLAIDSSNMTKKAKIAVDLLEDSGFRKKDILIYTLYNFYDEKIKKGDTPESFFCLIKNIALMGCTSYPMRYEPLDALTKNQYISPNWTQAELEYLADARRVIGFGGAFAAHRGLVEKFSNANSFSDAFKLRPKKG
jgi:hypothetical protein